MVAQSGGGGAWNLPITDPAGYAGGCAGREERMKDATTRLFALLGSMVFLVLVPGSVGVLVPWWISRWRFEAAPPWFLPVRVLGALLIAAGLAVAVDSFLRFALQGLGTPAPFLPPRRLVVTGFYRFVRNPMYLAGLSVLFGQSLLFANLLLLAYAAVFWLGWHTFVLVYEEPKLRRTFGPDYAAYCAHVPRWRPRLRPWRGNGDRERIGQDG